MVSAFIYGGKARCFSAECWILLLFIMLPQQTCLQPCVSSCGKVANISHPFRLKHDPESCGDKRYELDCVNNVAVLHLPSAEYHVQAINYKNHTIRLVDPNILATDCSSLPRYFLYLYNFTGYYRLTLDSQIHDLYQATLDRWDAGYSGLIHMMPLFTHIIYFNCTNPPSDEDYYVDTASCVDQHTYAVVDYDIHLARWEPGCHVKLVAATSFWGGDTYYNYQGNRSYIDIHRALDYGFELSWWRLYCRCGSNYCFINATTGEVMCYDDQGPGKANRETIELAKSQTTA